MTKITSSERWPLDSGNVRAVENDRPTTGILRLIPGTAESMGTLAMRIQKRPRLAGSSCLRNRFMRPLTTFPGSDILGAQVRVKSPPFTVNVLREPFMVNRGGLPRA